MRVLITCIPQAGHVQPLLPLAVALAHQGDDVVLASGADAEEPAKARALTFERCGPSFAEWYAALLARTRGVPGNGLPPERVERYFLPRLFGEVGTALVVDDLVKAVDEHRPDVIIFDPVMFAAPLVAMKYAVPAVQHTVGPLYDPSTLELVADAVSPIWREFGLDVPPAAGVFTGKTLAICPPSLDPAAGGRPDVESLRPVELPRQDAPPLPVAFVDPDRPLVYVTLGTFSNTNLAVFRLLLDALSDEPVNVVMTIGRDNDPASLAPVPPNVHTATFIPQADVLPHCAAAIHHAGAGTSFGVLAHGLPSVALPQSADNFTIGDRLAAAGAAEVVGAADVTAESVRVGLRSILEDPSYRNAARRLAGEIASMPSPAQVAAGLRTALEGAHP